MTEWITSSALCVPGVTQPLDRALAAEVDQPALALAQHGRDRRVEELTDAQPEDVAHRDQRGDRGRDVVALEPADEALGQAGGEGHLVEGEGAQLARGAQLGADQHGRSILDGMGHARADAAHAPSSIATARTGPPSAPVSRTGVHTTRNSPSGSTSSRKFSPITPSRSGDQVVAREADAGVLVVRGLVDVDRLDAERAHAEVQHPLARLGAQVGVLEVRRGAVVTTPARCGAARSRRVRAGRRPAPRAPGRSPRADPARSRRPRPRGRRTAPAGSRRPAGRRARSGTAHPRACPTGCPRWISSRLKPSRSMVLCTSNLGEGSPG